MRITLCWRMVRILVSPYLIVTLASQSVVVQMDSVNVTWSNLRMHLSSLSQTVLFTFCKMFLYLTKIGMSAREKKQTKK